MTNSFKSLSAITLLSTYLIACSQATTYEPVSSALTSTDPIIVAKPTSIQNGVITNMQIFNYDLQGAADQSSNGTIYYDNNIIISPGTQDYMSPIHLLKKNNNWILESASYGKIIDRARNIYKVSNGNFVWANAGTESETNPTGNLYVSLTNQNNSLTWKRLSENNKAEFYHYAASGDIDGDGNSDILSYVGAETESPELFKLFIGPNFDNTDIIFPTAKEFETALGFTNDDRKKVGAGFSFGSITVGNLDLSTPGNELILTSTKALMNEYYSFILLNYDKTTHKFKINKIIKPGGLLLENKMGVADVKTGDFNGDNISDIVVTMGNHISNEFNGIQVWINDGNGNLIPNKKKSELYCKANNNIIYFSNFEVGKFRGRDCIFLHFEGTRYIPRPENNFDLNPFLLINNTNEGGFTYEKSIPILNQAPGYVKGYFENNSLRLIGIRTKQRNEFDLTDLIIQ